MIDRDQTLRDAMADAVLAHDKARHTGAESDRRAWAAELAYVWELLSDSPYVPEPHPTLDALGADDD